MVLMCGLSERTDGELQKQKPLVIVASCHVFLATLVALHFTPVSRSVGRSAEFRTSVASRLASLFHTAQTSIRET